MDTNHIAGFHSLHRRASFLASALLLCAVLGSLIFTLSWMIDGLMRPGYDAWRQPISALSLGPGGWVQSATFITFGVLVAVSALGWRLVLTPGRGQFAIPMLKLVTAMSLIADGIFAQDPGKGYPVGSVAPTVASLHETIHSAGAVVAITSLAITCFVFSWRFGAAPAWRAWAVFAAASGILTVIFIAAFGAAGAGYPAGLYERLSTSIQSLFTLLLVGRILLLAHTTPFESTTQGASGVTEARLPLARAAGAVPPCEVSR